jgi:four helix bundle protein
MGSKEFTHLIVWQKAHQVRMAVFETTEKPPISRMFRLASQMQGAALSVPGNIAEGFGRRHARDKAHFYTMAKGSADELKDQLIFTRDKGYWKDNLPVQANLEEVCRMLRSLIDKTLGGNG